MKTERPTPPGRGRRPVPQLPHAYPFRMLDTAQQLDPGRWAVVLKNVSRGDPLVDSDGVLPPVLLAEAMAQAAGLVVAGPSAAVVPAMLARIDRFRCSTRAVAGDQLLVTVRLIKRFGAMVKVRASVHIGGRPRAAAELLLHFSRTARGKQ